MVKSKNACKHERHKRRYEMSRQSFRINNAFEWRTLRKSARHQIARDRATRLWIYPWITDPTGRFKRHYPEASLLGLPIELRQNIIYKAFDMTELSDMVKQPGKKGKKLAAQTKVIERELRQRRDKSLGIRMTQFESDSITMLHRRIGDFCCVSELIQTDMEYVGKLWKRDLDEQLEWQFPAPLRLPKDPVVCDSRGRMMNQTGMARNSKRLEGKLVKVKRPGKHAGRPPKCWRCEERHFDGDLVCPMARYNSEQWQQLSKKMGGWRNAIQPCSLFRATKILFADD
ncbi:hypothetical protein AA0119_g984 [Alternaria tenuissima]|uniref:Uncharacterized protein n=1 Tax=Alternaria tenuissima TaxID=119927 RepID=A0ABY0GS06_9PLEO|nr:hypothetical protein AA0119_g984 [Alternaria tenuissima]RYO21566.1 hypothetical protein AA0121_g3162 [Alternaria tenuissima]